MAWKSQINKEGEGMQNTKNYRLRKIELSDSPPDITVQDYNWDKIDTVLGAASMIFTNTSENDAYEITIPGVASQEELTGIPIKFKAAIENTTSCTLNVNGYGAYAICKDVSAELETGDILADCIVPVVWDGTRYQLMQGNGTATKDGTQTLKNKTLTAPKLGSGGHIADTNGNEIIKTVSTVTSAVNEVTVKNAATGNAPGFDATGGDTNIDLEINGKGTGALKTARMTVGTRKAGSTIGENSFSSGSNNTASGEYAYAEGNNTASLSLGAHSEGGETRASDHYAHAEGFRTIANGGYTHAEGMNTTAITNTTHAEGAYSTASTGLTYSIKEFDNSLKTITLNAVGSLVVGAKLDIFVSNSTDILKAEITAINELVVTLNTSGTLNAFCKYAVLRNLNGYPSHAEGISCLASGNASHAEGDNTLASGHASHAEGNNTMAVGSYSHAEGNSTKAVASHTHVEGSATEASGAFSHAEGHATKANGWRSHAEGYATVTKGDASHAEGTNTVASGAYAHAEGYYTNANGDGSHAEGNSTISGGPYSHAEGQETQAIGEYSHSEGLRTVANGICSHAGGLDTACDGFQTFAHGVRLKAKGQGQAVFGRYNAPDATDLFQIGVGTSDSNRKNALVVTSNGNLIASGSLFYNPTNMKGSDFNVFGGTGVLQCGYDVTEEIRVACHMPTLYAGILEFFLLDSGYSIQRYTDRENYLYVRRGYQGVWSAWAIK